MLKKLLEDKKCFKLVCGAGKEDSEEIKRLVYLYSLAGCKVFDLCANAHVINAAKEALDLADNSDACICVSVGIKNDPHVKKAVINYDKCVNCGACECVCPEGAINSAQIDRLKCVGCGRCWRTCSRAAISYISEEKQLEYILPDIINLGIDCIEFHAMGVNEDEIYSKWDYINSIYDGLLSICTSRGNLSDEALVGRIIKMTQNRKPYTTIIQADGFPMSGGENDYKSTLQTVATAQIVNNAQLPLYIVLSGGTNSKTVQLAKMCDVKFNGVAVGSYARKLVRKYIVKDNFWNNKDIINEAVRIIEPLVDSVIQ